MKKTNNQSLFLKSFFSNEGEEHYEELQVNGFYLVKLKNGDMGRWNVNVYTAESFERYKNAGQRTKEAWEDVREEKESMEDHIRSLIRGN